MTNWEIISTIIEIVGIIAVIATLFYVAIEIKLNSKQLKSTVQLTKTQNWHNINDGYTKYREMVLNNSELWIRGLNNLEELDSNEKMKFNMIGATLIWTTWIYYHVLKNEGLIPDANNELFRSFYKHEGLRAWMIEEEKYHTDDFGSFLKSVREDVGEDRYKFGESSGIINGIY